MKAEESEEFRGEATMQVVVGVFLFRDLVLAGFFVASLLQHA
jgi:hypothetical protein